MALTLDRHGTQQPLLGAGLNRTHPLAAGLVFALPFNEGSSPQIQDRAYGRLSTVPTGVIPWAQNSLGKEAQVSSTTGNCFDFGTPPAYVSTLNVLSVCAWVRLTTPAVRSDVVAQWDAGTNIRHFILGASTLATTAHADVVVSVDGTAAVGCVGTSTLVANTLYFIAGTFDNAHLAVYVNGKLETTSTLAGPLFSTSTAPLRVGSSSNNPCNGALSGALIYNRALTATEIGWLYAEPYALYTAPATARWGALAGAPAAGDPFPAGYGFPARAMGNYLSRL